ncbi:hypothetical protein QQZ08_012561, partial [Neonectria magnoliae]
MSTATSAQESASDDEVVLEPKNQPNPVETVRLYAQNPHVKDFVDTIATHCRKPTFIPVFESNLENVSADSDHSIATMAFVLAHAVQLLTLAPVEWRGANKYSNDPEQYAHRFPTTVAGGGTGTTVAGRFSMEDLNRAVLLYFYAISRRVGGGNVLTTRKPPTKGTFTWPGYVDPNFDPSKARQEPEDIGTDMAINAALDYETSAANHDALIDDLSAENGDQYKPIVGADAGDITGIILEQLSSGAAAKGTSERFKKLGGSDMAALTSKTLKKTLKTLRRLHDLGDASQRLEKTQATSTSLKHLVDNQELEAYLTAQSDCPEIVNFTANKPEEMEGLLKEMSKQYANEMFMASLQPKQTRSLGAVCEEHGLDPYPHINLYKDHKVKGIQDLKPHQLL